MGVVSGRSGAAATAGDIRGGGLANGLSYLQTRGGRRLVSSRDGASPSPEMASLSYHPVGGFALVAGQPVGPVSAWGPLLDDFEALCASEGLAAAFCGVNSGGVPFFRERGYRLLRAGDEGVVDLASLHLTGRRWRECRAALNRAARRGVTLDWVEPGHLTLGLLRDLRAVSNEWLARRPFPEMAFLLGEADDLADPQDLLTVARGPDGRVEGFVTWTPVPSGGGWMLDMMRRRSDAMAGLMDLLIVRSLLRMRAEGWRSASLGGTPLSNVGGERDGVLRWALDVAFRRLRGGYRFQPLHHFKRKFNPRWEPLYLAVQPGASAARALHAVVRACNPDLRPRHVALAVVGIR